MPDQLATTRPIRWLLPALSVAICCAGSVAAGPPCCEFKGPGYSARFVGSIFQYSSANSHSTDLVFQARTLMLGAQQVRLGAPSAVRTAADNITFYYRDVLSESYTALDDGVEQCWVINRRPRLPADIVIEASIRSPHTLISSPGGLEVVGKRGRRICSYGLVTVIDSRGKRITRSPAYGKGRLTIRIPSSYVAKAEFPIMIDPMVGPETSICPSFGPAPGMQGNVEIAAGADGYFAVWQDSRGANGMDIFGCRLSPTGQVLDAMGIAICNSSGDQTDPSVAWDGREFLVVWADRRETKSHAYGSRVRPNGEVLEKGGMLISSTTGTQAFPRVASDGSSWYVVWQETRTASPDIYGCKVNSDGVPQRIYSITTRSDNEETPDVAWNGSAYVVVWRDYRNIASTDTDIYGCRVARNGIRMAGDTIISCNAAGNAGANQAQRYPRLCGFGANCMAVWEDLRADGSSSDVYGARIGSVPSFQVLDKGGILISAAAGDQNLPSVAYNGSQMLATWRNNNEYLTYGTRISTSGSVLDPTGILISNQQAGASGPGVAGLAGSFMTGLSTLDPIASKIVVSMVLDSGSVPNPSGAVISTALDDQADYAVADNGSEYAVVWAQNLGGAYDIMGARLSHGGSLLTPTAVNISSAAGNQVQPAIAWNGSCYLVVWSGDETFTSTTWDIRGLRLNSSLVRLDSTPIQIAVATNNQVKPCVASVGGGGANFLVAYEDSRNALSPYYYTDIYGAIVSSAGAVTPTAVNTSTGDQRRPRVVSNGTDYFVVWEDYRSSSPLIYGARVTSAGVTQDAAGIAMPATYYYQTSPEVCCGGGNYLVSWSDGYRATGCRVSPAGVVLDTSGIFIDTYPAYHMNPFACYDGSQYRVVWEDYRSTFTGNADVYYTTIGLGGAVSSSPSMTLASDLAAQLAPRVFAWGDLGMLFYSRYYNYANSVCAATLTEVPVQELATVAQAKSMPPGTPVALRGKVVTGAFSGYFYCQELNRTSGIKVLSSVSVHKGDVVDVVGTMSLSDGERYLNASMISMVGAAYPQPQPFGMIGDSVGGGPLNIQTPGITGAFGTSNIGLLVMTWGKVTSSAGDCFLVETKPGVSIKVKSGSLTEPAVGKYVSVTGISTCEVVSGSLARVMLTREQADIQILQ